MSVVTILVLFIRVVRQAIFTDRNGCFTERTRILLLNPGFDAVRMEDVFDVTGHLDDHRGPFELVRADGTAELCAIFLISHPTSFELGGLARLEVCLRVVYTSQVENRILLLHGSLWI